MTPFRVDGRVALVTGGASGIGEQTSRILAEAGAQVIVADLNQTAAEKLAAELPNQSRGAGCDISDPASVESLFSSLVKLDILVNNSGIGLVGNIEETALDDFQRLFRVNVEGM